MYSVQCTVYNVQCTMYIIQSKKKLYNVQCTLYNYILYNVVGLDSGGDSIRRERVRRERVGERV